MSGLKMNRVDFFAAFPLYFQQGGGGNSGSGNLNIQNIGEPTAGNQADIDLLNDDDNDEGNQRVKKSTIKTKSTGQSNTDDNTDDNDGNTDVDDDADNQDDDNDDTGSDGGDDDDSNLEDDEELDIEDPEEESEDEDEDEDEDSDEDENDKQAKNKDKSIFGRLKDVDKDIFKKVPELRNIVAQHTQFKNIFDSPELAQQAYLDSESLQVFSDDLSQGNIKGLFQAFHKSDPQSVKLLAKNILPQLYEVDREAYSAAMRPEFIDLVHNMLEDGENSGNKNLAAAAKWLSKFLFRDFNPPARAGRGETPEEKRLREENERILTESFDREVSKIRETTMTILNGQIEAILDPKRKLPIGQRKAMQQEILSSIGEELKKDRAYGERVERIRASAKRTRFGRGEDASLKNAFLARVKTLVGPTTKRVMEEWNVESNTERNSGNGDGKGSKNRGNQNNDRNQNRGNNSGNNSDENSGKRAKGRIPSGGNANRGNNSSGSGGERRNYNPDDIDWNKTTNVDFMNGKFWSKSKNQQVRYKRQYSNA